MSEIKLTKPKSIWKKDIKMDSKGFALSLFKVVSSQGSDGWTDLLSSLNLSNNSREEQAWILFFSALTASFKALLDDYPELLPPNPTPSNDKANETFVNRLIQQFETQEIILTSDFFNNPSQFLDDSAWETLITDWLKEIGFPDEQSRDAFVFRLKSQFTLALHEEWSRNAEQYTEIVKYLDSPFLPATKRERELARYRAFLQQQVDERVFNETFGLKQIYIPLRAYYETQPETSRYNNECEHTTQKHVVDLHTEMNAWIDDKNPDNRLRIICGGPGSGKSSFAKMLAAEQASKNHLPVLFVPLHRFKLKDYLLESISSFVENHPYLQGTNPIENQENNAVLMIFDGLDELSMQGAKAERTAEEFIVNVQTILRDNPRWKAIITGREVAIQTHKALLNQPKMLWHMLPYFLDEDEKEAYTDPNELLATDQRHQWWQTFGQLKGLPYDSGLPQELATEHLQPITREPLLNYLVALTYQAQRIQFDDNTNLNQIYADLLKSVYERQYERAGKHRSIQQLEKEEFEQVLEEIALTVWHGNGRTASVNTLVTQCTEAGLGELLKRFQDNAEQGGVMRLMTAFYFREFGKDESGDKTFEFTHKSFGEYLTARRIMAGLDDMCEEVARNKKRAGRGWTLEEAFVKWLKLCGAEAIDWHLYKFIADEIQLISQRPNGIETLLSYQKLMFELLTMAVKEQSPVKKLNLETFKDDLKYSMYAESALLILHGLCANHTQQVLEQNDEQFKSLFRKWFQRNQYGVLLHRACQYLDLSKMQLAWIDLVAVNLTGTNLSGTNLFRTYLNGAYLRGANLSGAYLSGANLSEAYLRGANLSEAEFFNVDLTRANLRGANLSGTDLREANLSGTDLREVDLSGAIYSEKDLEGAILENETFE